MNRIIPGDKRAAIVAWLAKAEQEHGVRVLYACESGSRAWGFPSQDSDYDVRFIYAHPLPWYVSVATRRDVVEYPVDDMIDLSGWDLHRRRTSHHRTRRHALERADREPNRQ